MDPIIGPYLFLGKFVWTNGPESFSKVSPYTGIGPWMALPNGKERKNGQKNREGKLQNDKRKETKKQGLEGQGFD